MSLVFRAAAAGVAGALCAVALKKQAPEFALLLGMVTAALLLSWAAGLLGQVVTFLEELGEMAGLSSDLIAPLLKTVAIGLVTKITAELCRDAGEGGVGAAAEFAGGVAAVTVSLPLIRTVLNTLQQLL